MTFRRLFSLISALALLAAPANSQAAFMTVPNSITNGTISQFTSGGTPSTFPISDSSSLSFPSGVALDAAGNVYVSTSNYVRKYVAGGSGFGSFYTPAGISNAAGLAFDTSGNLYVADPAANKVLKIAPGGGSGSLTTFASGLSNPYALAFDSAGNLYVTNSASTTVTKITPGGGVSTAVTGLTGGPSGIAIDSADTLYISFNGNSIRKITSGGSSSILATGLSLPLGLAVDNAGFLYSANFNSDTISKISTTTGAVTTFASGPNIDNPRFIALNVPEPTTCAVLLLAAPALLRKRTHS